MSEIAPPTERFALRNRDGSMYEFSGQLLGSGSSYALHKERWFQVDIYRRAKDNTFVVYTQGVSLVEGETTRVRVVETASGFDVIEVLTVIHNGKMYIPRQSTRALAQAAHWDDDIRDAYVNRAVT